LGVVKIPEFRKLINFGKTSYVISLPKGWIKKNNLKKGDTVVLKRNSEGLIILPKISKKKERLEVQIKADGKSLEELRREIIANYIDGYNTIRIIGEHVGNISGRIKRNVLNKLMGIEIIEEGSKKLILKDFIDPEQMDVLELIRKADIMVRELFIDVKDFFKKPKVSIDNLYARDDEINRITYFVSRIIKYKLEISDSEFSPMQFLIIWQIMSDIERIGDEVKRLGKYLKKLESEGEIKMRIKSIYSEVEKLYLDVMRALFLKNRKLALKLAPKKTTLITKLKKLSEKAHQVLWAQNIIEKMKNIVLLTNNIGRMVSHLILTNEQ